MFHKNDNCWDMSDQHKYCKLLLTPVSPSIGPSNCKSKTMVCKSSAFSNTLTALPISKSHSHILILGNNYVCSDLLHEPWKWLFLLTNLVKYQLMIWQSQVFGNSFHWLIWKKYYFLLYLNNSYLIISWLDWELHSGDIYLIYTTRAVVMNNPRHLPVIFLCL